ASRRGRDGRVGRGQRRRVPGRSRMSGALVMRSPEARWRRLLWPPVIVSVLLFCLPQAAFIWLSVQRDLGLGRVAPEFSFGNYLTIVTDPFYLRSVGLTVLLALEATVVGLIGGFPPAYALARLGNWIAKTALGLILTTSLITIVIKLMGLNI